MRRCCFASCVGFVPINAESVWEGSYLCDDLAWRRGLVVFARFSVFAKRAPLLLSRRQMTVPDPVPTVLLIDSTRLDLLDSTLWKIRVWPSLTSVRLRLHSFFPADRKPRNARPSCGSSASRAALQCTKHMPICSGVVPQLAIPGWCIHVTSNLHSRHIMSQQRISKTFVNCSSSRR